MRFKLNAFIITLAVLSLIIWSAIFQRFDSQHFHLYMLNVGQGVAIYIRFPDGFDVLYDGGPDDRVLSELGRVMPAWDHEINLMIASHNHSDHLSGLIEVLERYEIEEIWTTGAKHNSATYRKFISAVDQSEAKTKTCYIEHCQKKGRIWVLYPFNDLSGTTPANQNNASLVVRIEYGQTSILLPGDVEKESEAEMVQFYSDRGTNNHLTLQSDILQSPHQGSHSSSTKLFLQAVDPSDVIIAVGEGNQYGHPHADVLARYKSMGFNIYRTDQCGRIEVEADLKNYQIFSRCPK